jgi:hypothetical protein
MHRVLTGLHLTGSLCGSCCTRELLPGLKSLCHFLPVLPSGQAMPTGAEICGDQTIRRQEALRVPSGLASLHPPFPLPRGLMRILCAVIEVAVLSVFHARQDLTLCHSITFQLVGNDHAGERTLTP